MAPILAHFVLYLLTLELALVLIDRLEHRGERVEGLEEFLTDVGFGVNYGPPEPVISHFQGFQPGLPGTHRPRSPPVISRDRILISQYLSYGCCQSCHIMLPDMVT